MVKTTLCFLILMFALAFSGCRPVKNHDFAIYLLAQDLPATELPKFDINALMLASEPLIGIDDMVAYHKTNHLIELTPTAYTRVQQLFSMPVRVNGIPFVVCVGEERIYTGAFWTPVSSLSYDGVVIMQPLDPQATTIQLALGYPAPEVFTGHDPRADPRLLKALE